MTPIQRTTLEIIRDLETTHGVVLRSELRKRLKRWVSIGECYVCIKELSAINYVATWDEPEQNGLYVRRCVRLMRAGEIALQQ